MSNRKLPDIADASITRLARGAIPGWLFAAALLGLACAIFSVSSQRTGFSLDGAETDFVVRFGPEAQRILAGDPLEISFHLPGYPFVLAPMYRIVGDWLTTALLISGVAAIVTIIASAMTAHRLLGPEACWGTLATAICSSPFMSYASQASSDMWFAALATTTLAFLVAALTGTRCFPDITPTVVRNS